MLSLATRRLLDLARYLPYWYIPYKNILRGQPLTPTIRYSSNTLHQVSQTLQGHVSKIWKIFTGQAQVITELQEPILLCLTCLVLVRGCLYPEGWLCDLPNHYWYTLSKYQSHCSAINVFSSFTMCHHDVIAFSLDIIVYHSQSLTAQHGLLPHPQPLPRGWTNYWSMR